MNTFYAVATFALLPAALLAESKSTTLSVSATVVPSCQIATESASASSPQPTVTMGCTATDLQRARVSGSRLTVENIAATAGLATGRWVVQPRTSTNDRLVQIDF